MNVCTHTAVIGMAAVSGASGDPLAIGQYPSWLIAGGIIAAAAFAAIGIETLFGRSNHEN